MQLICQQEQVSSKWRNSYRPSTKFPEMATKLDARIENKFEAEQKVQPMKKRQSSIPANDQDQMEKTLTNPSPNEKCEFVKSIDCEVSKLIEKFNQVIISI